VGFHGIGHGNHNNKVMMKEKSEIVAESKQYFDAYPNAKTFYVTSDGMFFEADNKSQAESHQRSLKVKGVDEPVVINRSDLEEPKDTKPKDTKPKGKTKGKTVAMPTTGPGDQVSDDSDNEESDEDQPSESDQEK
jgi:hypothetical protein